MRTVLDEPPLLEHDEAVGRRAASPSARLRIANRWRVAPKRASNTARASRKLRPQRELPAAVMKDAAVDPFPEHQRREHGRALPAEPREHGACDPRALLADLDAEEASSLLARVSRHGREARYTLGAMPVPIEQRFPRPSVMGVLNVTPDSFSDGGVHFRTGDAVAAGRRMVAEGAALVDVGGESTRPGAEPVSVEEELRRIVPVLEGLAGLTVSVDTTKAEVARVALELGAVLVNDVTALRADPDLAGVVADCGAYLCLMHMQGEPRTMQADPRYADVVAEVVAFLEQRLRFAVDAGVDEERICLDPGIGFGKTVEHNLELLRRLDAIAALGRPVLVGISRKSTLGRLLGDPDARTGSTAASVSAAVLAFERGASILRVHDVREHVEALAVAAAL